MRTNAFREAKISLATVAILLSTLLVFYIFASMFTTMGISALRRAERANAEINNKTVIVLDPGHGGEDPGACANGLEEKHLNLEITIKLKEFLENSGNTVVLTRNEDVLLYNEGQEKQKKYFDLRNREVIANEYENAIFVSIHFNKFPLESCSGLQAFYSNNNEKSHSLAQSIQDNITLLQTDNKRTVKNGTDTIYLLEQLMIPSVLIECGFLSNVTEAKLLSEEDYKNALAFSLYCGIAEYLEDNLEN